MSLNVVIADGHHIYREGLAAFLDKISLISTVQQVTNGEALLDFLKKKQVDLLFFDVTTSNGESIDLALSVKAIQPETKIIAMTFSDSIVSFDQFLTVGIDGYLLKNFDCQVIEEALHKVIKGGKYYPESMLIRLVNKSGSDNSSRLFENIKFTNREKQILQYYCKGFGRKEISSILEISEKTVDKHKENLLKKTRMKNMVMLALFAFKNGLVKVNM